MRPASVSLAVVIPAYNEAARLGRSLTTVLEFLNQCGPSEVIVVDDGSNDGTADVAERSLRIAGQVAATVLRVERNRGKGYALRSGLLAAQAPLALFMDADLSTPLAEVPRIVNPILLDEADVVIGSRALDRSLTFIRQPWWRETGGRLFNLAIRAATGLRFWDTQCGFKAFRMDLVRPILHAATIDGFAFDVEWLYVAHRAGLRLQEIPVRWDHCDGSKVSLRRHSLQMLQEIQRIRRQARAGVYENAIARIRAAVGESSAAAGHRMDDRGAAIA
jgi:dolichyl-phosphate beta-glucosyltransferase